MACTTAPIVAKPATYGWLTPMTTSTGQNVCELSVDPRLVRAAVGAFAAHAARLAGWSREIQEEAGKAAVEVAQSLLPTSAKPDARLRLSIAERVGQFEVSIESSAWVSHESAAAFGSAAAVLRQTCGADAATRMDWLAEGSACRFIVQKYGTPRLCNSR